MSFTGNEILAAAEYVKKYGITENGYPKEYHIGKVLPSGGGIGYKRLISTKGAPKEDIADVDAF